jgi:hypothetical protein
MPRYFRALAAVAMLGFALTSAPLSSASAATKSTPPWVKHIERYPGGISGGVRAMVSPEAERARAQVRASALTSPGAQFGPNVQMNDDSNPPLPQNETSVAYSIANPMVAVAAANDYVSGGVVVMRTSDGGRHWRSTRIQPQFRGTGDFCTGGDPAVAYSRRDRAFFVGQLCFFRSQAFSEVQIYKSVDNGATWTPGRESALAATNFNYSTGTVDTSIFNDKDYITVDNYPNSPHYGRLYVTYTKFHIQPNGFSDYCPIQVAYTDNVPTFNPSLTVFGHVPVVPDNPGGNGKGPSANQFSVPVVEKNGTLDISYVIEECNTSLDHHFYLRKSLNGGASFSGPLGVDKPGQFVDNPNLADLLPNKAFRAPNTESLAYSPATGTLVYMYTNYKNMTKSGGNIVAQVSHDGGYTWSNDKTISIKPGGGPAPRDQFFPWAAASPNGRFSAMWLDCRLDPSNHNITTFQANSANDGATWPNIRIGTKAWDPDRGFFTSGAFIGDYSGIAAANNVVYPVWTDGRNSSINRTGIGETDIFTNVEIHS